MTTKLTPKADAFVPSFGGMNIEASEWKPTSSPTLDACSDAIAISPQEFTLETETSLGGFPMLGINWDAAIASMHTSSLSSPPKRNLRSIGVPEPTRKYFLSLDSESLRQLPPDDNRYKEIPTRFHSILNLDKYVRNQGTGGSFGYPSATYRVTDRFDSHLYTLRRFENVKINQSVIRNAQDNWLCLRHPSVVSLHLITQEKGATFFSHEYHPLAVTLKEKIKERRAANFPEDLMWSILSQLLLGMRFVHKKGLAIRAVDVNHVLLTPGFRLRYGCVGISDVLDFESRKSVAEWQVEDIQKLGILLISSAAQVNSTSGAIEQGKAVIRENYSSEFYNVIEILLSGKVGISKVLMMISEHVCDKFDENLASFDSLHEHLRQEYENGRLNRLLMKFGFVNERPDNTSSSAWSETGDRYILKLFRDFLFHQNLPDNSPALDCGHVICALNKVDAGCDEEILLSSRNGKDLLVVTYADVNRCLENSFLEISSRVELLNRCRSTGANMCL